jgi:hypothetical protein
VGEIRVLTSSPLDYTNLNIDLGINLGNLRCLLFMTTSTNLDRYMWVLGASDPEMQAIEALLRLHVPADRIEYARDSQGTRVHPGNAYKARRASVSAYVDTIYVHVECEPEPTYEHSSLVCDHHRDGDPGHGKGPGDFLAASTLGQVVALLVQTGVRLGWPERHDICELPGMFFFRESQWWVGGWQGDHVLAVPTDLVLCAAADHCCGSAYKGLCTGVDPDELMAWRVKSKAAFQRRSPAEVMAFVAAAQHELRSASEVTLGLETVALDRYGQDADWSGYPVTQWEEHPITVRDMRRPAPIPELPEAAMRLGVGYLSGPFVGNDNRGKYTCSGSPEQIAAFLAWAPRQGLIDIYGDAARGFAGGYSSEETP